MAAGDDALPIDPEVAKIPASLVMCVYGVEEKHTGCPELADHGVTVIRTNGAHHFDGDGAAIEKLILASVRM